MDGAKVEVRRHPYPSDYLVHFSHKGSSRSRSSFQTLDVLVAKKGKGNRGRNQRAARLEGVDGCRCTMAEVTEEVRLKFRATLRISRESCGGSFGTLRNFADSGSHSHFDHPIRLPMQSLTPKPQNGQMLRFQVVTLVFYPSSDESVVDSLPLYSAGANCGLLTTATAIRPNETVVRGVRINST